MRAYPQKQTVIIFALSVLIVGGVAFYVFQGREARQTAHAASLQPIEVSTQTIPAVIASDTDWRKQFLTATSSSFAAPKLATQKETFASSTATYSLGQNFITQYVLLRQSGQSGDMSAINTSMDQVASKSIDTIDGPATYTASHVSVVNDDVAARAAYAQIIGTVAARYEASNDEADVAASAFENEDMSHLAELDPIISDYRSMITALLSVRVPRPLAQYHINLLNGLSALVYSSEAFRHMDTDPMKGFAAIKTDAVGTQAVDNMLYLINQNLTGSISQR
jgi:hypothetical protein